jgi:hypothetical protein
VGDEKGWVEGGFFATGSFLKVPEVSKVPEVPEVAVAQV